ncbi:MAG: hypothetical protein COV99_07450 [Bacteroidetes bacterium CG12_big_fil_rev_8_21_14_0_65_60_17]|nr:MAG: hypothetical protein COV99_07450 [Bacteroidetes bacterium CG12_big_fil_rev_8_21_14_0_65_60_17]
MTGETKIKVLLIEGNRLVREGIASVLREYGDFHVVAQSEGLDAVRQVKELQAAPDVVLMDLGLTTVRSLKLMSVLRSELPQSRVIAMDILPDEVDIVEFVKAGGSGFILKDATLNDYVTTIKAVSTGEKVLPSVLTKSLFTQIIETSIRNGVIPAGLIDLTTREREVVELISEGLTNKEIARRLNIAVDTVKSHVHNVLEKLALSTRLQIAAFAHREKE